MRRVGHASHRNGPRNTHPHPDEHRLIVEMSSVYVQCDDCGHSRVLYLKDLQSAAELGVHNYRELCRKIRCSECPKMPPAFRNLTIRPTWATAAGDHMVA